MKAFGLILALLTVTVPAFAAEVCEIHPVLTGSDGAAAHCTNLDDGRSLNATALPKVAVVKKLLEMGYVAKGDALFIKQ
jgi:hypothetical protein